MFPNCLVNKTISNTFSVYILTSTLDHLPLYLAKQVLPLKGLDTKDSDVI